MKCDILPLWFLTGRGVGSPDNGEDVIYGRRITSSFGCRGLRTRMLPELGNNAV